jgi:hypothetical protein
MKTEDALELKIKPSNPSWLTRFDRADHHHWTPRPPKLQHSVQLAKHSKDGDNSDDLFAMHSKYGENYDHLLEVCFGGSNGELLKSLTEITLVLGKEFQRARIAGLRFTYCDGTKLCRGSQRGVIQTFFIDGPGGERISKVSVTQERQATCYVDVRYHPVQC